MYHIFFIHLSVNGHLGCFHDLAIVNTASMNIGVHVFLELWFSLGICTGVGLMGHMVILFLVFKGTSIWFSIVAVSIYIPTNSTRGFLFATPSPAFVVCRFSDDAHSNRSEVIPHCSFDLHFSNN